MSDTDLVMYRGDDRSFSMTVSEEGAPLDLTGAASVRFTAKRKVTDEDADAVITLTDDDGIVITNAPAGVVRVDIPAAATAELTKQTTLLWDLQVKDADGKTRSVPEPSLEGITLGTLLIRVDVTRAAT